MLSTPEPLLDGIRRMDTAILSMVRMLRATLVLVFALFLMACGPAPPPGGFTRPVRGGSAVRFARQDLMPARWRIRSNLHVQLQVQHEGQTKTVGGGVDRLFDAESLGPERDGSARAKIDIHAWNDSSPDGSTPRTGRSSDRR